MDQSGTVSLSSDQTAALLAAAAVASPRERVALEDQVIRAHLPLAARISSRYRDRGIELEDLCQVANMALVKALRRFDHGKGEFAHYASVTISGELKKHFRDHGWTIRPPRDVQTLQAEINDVTQDWLQSHPDEPTSDELATVLRADIRVVKEARASRGMFRPTSLDAPVGNNAGRTVGDTIAITDHRFEVTEAWADLVPACRHLDSRERELIELRFYRGWTQAQIAASWGVSQMQVSRRLTSLLDKLRAAVDSPTAA